LTDPGSIVEYAIQPMCCLPAITLFANALGKYLNLTRTLSGFNRLTRAETNHAGAVLSHKLASEFSQIAEIDAPIAGVSVESEFLTNYLEISSTEDPSDRMARTLCPVTTLGCLALFVFSLLFTHSLPMAITITAAAFAVTAPFSMILCAALPLLIHNHAAGAENAQVAGYGAVEEFEDVDSVVLSANDLFPGGSITLYGIKTLGIDKIDDHILDAASIVCYAKSTLAPIFMQVIEGKTQLLRQVDSVVIENGMGLSGWVNGRRVLVGNRDLLQNHGIDVPSREYEAKFIQEHRDIVYLATSGEISAMFIVGYAADPHVEKSLGRLLKNNLSMLVCSNDPNITPRKLATVFTFPVNMIRIIPGKSMGRFHELKRKKLRMPANIANDGSMHSFICALSAVRAIRKSLSLSTLLQSLSIILGFITVAVVGLTLQQDMGPLTVSNLLIFQSLWSLASLGLPLLRRV
ncbi:MAG: hypothetical protein IKM54_05670, partial [Butyricicoccus sp.]|nr:hypothetical protein [Butyricicoccus sp.]